MHRRRFGKFHVRGTKYQQRNPQIYEEDWGQVRANSVETELEDHDYHNNVKEN